MNADYSLVEKEARESMKEMDDVTVSVEGNRIIITKAIPTSIKELFEGYSDEEKQEEVDWERHKEKYCANISEEWILIPGLIST